MSPAKRGQPKEGRLNIRVPEDLRERLVRLIPKARRLPECALTEDVKLSDVGRVAILRGVEVLERELGGAAGKRL